MQVHIDEEIYTHYQGEDLGHAKLIIQRIQDSAARLSKDMIYDLTIRDLEVIERLAKQSDATDADVFYIYCEGFARGRDYEREKSEGGDK